MDQSVHEVDKERKPTASVEETKRSIIKQQLNGVGVNNLMFALKYV